jgi:hypothetical protein
VAVDLTGASLAHVGRGHALVRGPQWRPAQVVDASLEVLASLDHEVGRRGSFAAYLGSGAAAAGTTSPSSCSCAAARVSAVGSDPPPP